FGLDPQPISDVSAVSGPTGAVHFSPALSHLRVGSGWLTWSHGYTGDVYALLGDGTATIYLPPKTRAFSMYVEPNVRSEFFVLAIAQDGTTSQSMLVNGDAGARYVGFYGTGQSYVTSIRVDSTDASGFAIGEFAIAH